MNQFDGDIDLDFEPSEDEANIYQQFEGLLSHPKSWFQVTQHDVKRVTFEERHAAPGIGKNSHGTRKHETILLTNSF